jgi:thiol-disulfide isomerase/thioredoxin
VRLSDFAGQAVILNFWASWCPPCRREMPLLDEFNKAYSEKGLGVVGIDLGESANQVKSYIESIGVSYPIWVDAPAGLPGFDRTQKIFERVGGVGLPTTLFIDQSGFIHRIYIGELSRGFLQSQANILLDR